MNKIFLNWINGYFSNTREEISKSKVEVIKRVLSFDDDKLNRLYNSMIELERDEKISSIIE